jgi:hypothetical protein
MHHKGRFPNVFFGANLRLDSAALAIMVLLLFLIFVLLFLTLTAQPVQAQTYKVIHNFWLAYSPATVMPSMRIVGEAMAPRNSRSLPISAMLKNMSFKLPATVISSTG